MSRRQNIEYIDLSDLQLDPQNPRLPVSFRRHRPNEKEIVNRLLEDSSLIELMLAIGQAGFFVGEALLVVKEDYDKYVVVEGNRRLASTFLLNDPELASVHKKKVAQVIGETKERPSELPCIVFDSRKDVTKYLGYRHVTGIRTWGILAKARYLTELLEEFEEDTFAAQCKTIAKAIGSRSDYVRKLIVSYQLYELIEDENFFNIKGLDETSLFLNYYADSLSRENIRGYIDIDLNAEKPLENINMQHLADVTKWFFEKNSQLKSRVLGNAEQLGMLDNVLSNKAATREFEQGAVSITEAYKTASVNADSFAQDVEEILAGLIRIQAIVDSVPEHHEVVLDKLKDISKKAKGIHGSIMATMKEDDWDD